MTTHERRAERADRVDHISAGVVNYETLSSLELEEDHCICLPITVPWLQNKITGGSNAEKAALSCSTVSLIVVAVVLE